MNLSGRPASSSTIIGFTIAFCIALSLTSSAASLIPSTSNVGSSSNVNLTKFCGQTLKSGNTGVTETGFKLLFLGCFTVSKVTFSAASKDFLIANICFSRSVNDLLYSLKLGSNFSSCSLNSLCLFKIKFDFSDIPVFNDKPPSDMYFVFINHIALFTSGFLPVPLAVSLSFAESLANNIKSSG